MNRYDHEGKRGKSWWRLSRESAWSKANVLLAVAVGVYVIGFRFVDVYDWLTGGGFIFALGVLAFATAGAVVVVGWIKKRWGNLAGVWAIVGAVFVVFALGHAASDSATQRHSNCWHVSGPDSQELVACAPGSKPVTGNSYSVHNKAGLSRSCEYARSGAGRETLWNCVQKDF